MDAGLLLHNSHMIQLICFSDNITIIRDYSEAPRILILGLMKVFLKKTKITC